MNQRQSFRFTGNSRPSGFTLIELLIVVAIIAVLAAIAVPNFLEAQARSKVSRAHADLRTISMALEAYRVDESLYPTVGNPVRPSPSDLFVPYSRRLRPLTTPIAYITTLPTDPFAQVKPGSTSPDIREAYYAFAPGNLYAGAAAIYSSNDYRGTIYSVSSRGPDNNIYAGGYCMAHPAAYASKINIEGAYDPTNGTVSRGDIFRLSSSTLGH